MYGLLGLRFVICVVVTVWCKPPRLPLPLPDRHWGRWSLVWWLPRVVQLCNSREDEMVSGSILVDPFMELTPERLLYSCTPRMTGIIVRCSVFSLEKSPVTGSLLWAVAASWSTVQVCICGMLGTSPEPVYGNNQAFSFCELIPSVRVSFFDCTSTNGEIKQSSSGG